MIRKKKLTFRILLVFIVVCVGFIYESQYFNKVEFLPPIDYEGDIPVRHDLYGSGEFGARRKGGRTHKGIDILAKIGTPIKATRSGWVINAESEPGYGNYVEIKHPGGYISIYGHLSKLITKKWRRLRQGQIIGEVGKTGNAAYRNIKSHLHFEIRKDNKAVDPKEYLHYN